MDIHTLLVLYECTYLNTSVFKDTKEKEASKAKLGIIQKEIKKRADTQLKKLGFDEEKDFIEFSGTESTNELIEAFEENARVINETFEELIQKRQITWNKLRQRCDGLDEEKKYLLYQIRFFRRKFLYLLSLPVEFHTLVQLLYSKITKNKKNYEKLYYLK